MLYRLTSNTGKSSLGSSGAKTPTMPTYIRLPSNTHSANALKSDGRAGDLPHYLWAHEVLSTIRGGQRESQQEKTNKIYKPRLLRTSEPKQVNFTQPVCQAPSMTWESTLRGTVRAPFSSLDPSSFPLPEVHSTRRARCHTNRHVF